MASIQIDRRVPGYGPTSPLSQRIEENLPARRPATSRMMAPTSVPLARERQLGSNCLRHFRASGATALAPMPRTTVRPLPAALAPALKLV
jgi:hypothetical protein